jgi:uncharacterized protein (DUF433 family)
MAAKEYTPAQASAITGLPLAAVHKAIDTRLVRARVTGSGGSSRRVLRTEQLVYLQLQAEGLRLLPLSVRQEAAAMLERAPDIERLAVGGGEALFVDVRPARRKVAAQLQRLAKAEKMAVSDPAILGGTPVFRGTRIPVQLVADMLAQAVSPEEILEGYPALSAERIGLASLYVRAFPRRGRPARRPWAGKRPIRVTTQRPGERGRRVA